MVPPFGKFARGLLTGGTTVLVSTRAVTGVTVLLMGGVTLLRKGVPTRKVSPATFSAGTVCFAATSAKLVDKDCVESLLNIGLVGVEGREDGVDIPEVGSQERFSMTGVLGAVCGMSGNPEDKLLVVRECVPDRLGETDGSQGATCRVELACFNGEVGFMEDIALNGDSGLVGMSALVVVDLLGDLERAEGSHGTLGFGMAISGGFCIAKRVVRFGLTSSCSKSFCRSGESRKLRGLLGIKPAVDMCRSFAMMLKLASKRLFCSASVSIDGRKHQFSKSVLLRRLDATAGCKPINTVMYTLCNPARSKIERGAPPLFHYTRSIYTNTFWRQTYHV